MNKEKILTIDDMPMHKDTYFFGYGIDIEKPYEMANQIIKLREENKELSRIVASKVISDYDIDTPLKKELGEARLKIVSLEDAIHCYKQEKEDLIKWLEDNIKLCSKIINNLSKPFYADEMKIDIPVDLIIASYSQINYLGVLDKVKGVNNDN